jgi:hypothetical protein
MKIEKIIVDEDFGYKDDWKLEIVVNGFYFIRRVLPRWFFFFLLAGGGRSNMRIFLGFFKATYKFIKVFRVFSVKMGWK